jgi:DNA-binding beta-propeller fold protein YncE
MKKIYLLFLLPFLVSACCNKECGCNADCPDPERNFYNGAMILCEGAFNNGNAELTWEGNVSETAAYGKINQEALGDVLQSGLKIGNELWLTVNNSNKILVLNATTGRKTNRITGIPQPRFAVLANQKLYVTSMNFDTTASRLRITKISILNPQTKQILRSIPAPSCEQIVQTPDRSLWTGAIRFDKKNLPTHIYKIDSQTDTFTDSIAVGRNPYFMVCDRNGKLWVACGDYNVIQKPKLLQINPITKQIEQTIDFTDTLGAKFLTLDPTKENLYYIYKKDVFCKNVNTNITTKVLTTNAQFPYGLGINPLNGDIYVADAKGFATQGEVSIYKSNGIFIKKIKTDTGPNGFVFY